MNVDIKRVLIRIICILVIIFGVYTIVNTKYISKREQEKEIAEFEKNLEIQKKEDSSSVSVFETEHKPVGVLYIPKIGLKIPIYDSIDEDILSKGVGKLQSPDKLPPEPYQNTILTTHNGDSTQDLFINLNKLKIDDKFYIKDSSKKITKYEVKEIQVKLPTEEMKYIKRDSIPKVTLRTCTPTGINSHRLLVTGNMVDYSGIVPANRLYFSTFEMGIIGLSTSALILLLLPLREKKMKIPMSQNMK